VWVGRAGRRLVLARGRRRIVLNERDVPFIPFAVHSWEMLFETVAAREVGGVMVLNFSRPALHRYRRSGLCFHFPAFAEDDCMDAYMAAYRPQPGDVVWDVGAHAGMTTYFLAMRVGMAGRVYAFEPDETNYSYLLRNIERHQLTNVIPVKAALSGRTGTAKFCMDGTMGAGLSDSLAYAAAEHSRVVETLSVEDACARFGCIPDYIKLDIEGAELDAVCGALAFLRTHPIRMAIESNHLVGGQLTSGVLDGMLLAVGYRAWSSDEFGQRFTWAVPEAEVLEAAEVEERSRQVA